MSFDSVLRRVLSEFYADSAHKLEQVDNSELESLIQYRNNAYVTSDLCKLLVKLDKRFGSIPRMSHYVNVYRSHFVKYDP